MFECNIVKTSGLGDMNDFSDFVGNCGLIDLPMTNRKFTWTDGRTSPTLVRLDRFFINSAFEDLHSDSSEWSYVPYF